MSNRVRYLPTSSPDDRWTFDPPKLGRPETTWTLERKALLRRDYPAGVDAIELLIRLNALPGEPLTSTQRVAAYAWTLKLSRPKRGKPGKHPVPENRDKSPSVTPPVVAKTLSVLERVTSMPPVDIDMRTAIAWGQQHGVSTLLDVNLLRLKEHLPMFRVNGRLKDA